jgi:serine/threonine-protein kinase
MSSRTGSGSDGDRESPTEPGRRAVEAVSRGELRAQPLEIEPGAVVGAYRVEARRGGGGFASVYRARDVRTGAPVALKVLHAYLAGAPSVTRRFRLEADTIARLEDPRIVRLLDHGEHEGLPYLVMEWIEGETLAEALRARGPMPLDEALPILETLAGALAAAHALGIVHRDLKVANVALAPGGAKLLDFGIAKLADLDGASGFTTPGTKLGTPHYMAPEQILGGPVDARADVYAFGILMFEVLTGRRPFEDRNLADVEARQLAEPPPAASRLASVPAAIDGVIARAMAKDPARRHATIEDALADLRAAAAGAPVMGVQATRHPAVALYVHPRPRSEELDDDALDRLDRVVAEIRGGAAGLGLEVAAELGSSLLLLGLSPEDGAAVQLARVEAFAHTVAIRASDAGVSVALTVHVGEVEIEGERGAPRFVGGSLLDIGAWTRTDAHGVHVTPAART